MMADELILVSLRLLCSLFLPFETLYIAVTDTLGWIPCLVLDGTFSSHTLLPSRHNRQKVQLHSERGTTSLILRAVGVERSRIIFKRKLVLPVHTQPKRREVTTGD